MTLYGSSIAQVSLTAKAASGHTSCESTVWMSETTLTCSSALEVGASMIMPQMPTEARASSKTALPALGRSPSFVLLSLNGNFVSDLATRPPACDPRSMARQTMAHEPRSFNSLAAPALAPISQDVCCAAPYFGLATAVKTGPSSIATLALPDMQTSSGTLTPPPPRLEFALETSSGSSYVTSSHVSHHHALEASSPTSVTSRVTEVSCFYVEPAVSSAPHQHI